MDHFPVPPGEKPLLVPNLTLEEYTPGHGGFEGYPARKGWTTSDLAGHNSFGNRPIAEIQSFFQSWLYFGTFVEVLACTGVSAVPSDILDPTRNYLCTDKLPGLIQRSGRHLQLLEYDQVLRNKLALKAFLILRQVSDFVDLYCIPCRGARTAVKPGASPLPEEAWMAVIALGHTLMHAMIQFHGIVRTRVRWGASGLLKNMMLRRGWCPMDVERCLSDMGVDGHYYLAQLSNMETALSHEGCIESQCVARNINEATYVQRHEHGEGVLGCQEKEADYEGLVAILKMGATPVFRWDMKAGRLEMAAARPLRRGVSEPPYIAISHVWSDGMGNPTHNALPECQLRQIQTLVDAASDTSRLKGRPSYFWIDTLCVPVHPTPEGRALRNTCIQRMGGIYKDAAAVLVLSSTLRAVASTAPAIPRGLALYLANWNRRLWTFQEGMLARKLLLQFSDKAVSIKSSELYFPETKKSVAEGYCVTFPGAGNAPWSEFVILGDFLKMKLFDAMGPVHARMGPLAPAISAVRSRSTTKRKDETVCLGTLMRLKVGKLLDAENAIRAERGLGETDKISDKDVANRRMENFLTLVGVFPPDIVFNSVDRLKRDGFRWAPASFLGTPSDGLLRTVEGSPAFLDRDGKGLILSAPGFVLELPDNGRTYSCAHLIAEIPRAEGHFLIRIDPGRSSTFAWTPGARYAVVLSESLAGRMCKWEGSSRRRGTPKTGPALELWMEDVFGPWEAALPMVDAVIGTFPDSPVGGMRPEDGMQIRHAAVATVTVLNPADVALSEGKTEEGVGDDDISEDLDDKTDYTFESLQHSDAWESDSSQEVAASQKQSPPSLPTDPGEIEALFALVELNCEDLDEGLLDLSGEMTEEGKSLDLEEVVDEFGPPVAGTEKERDLKWFIL